MRLRTGFLMVVLAFPFMSAHAAALSRTDQNVNYLFESGNNAAVGVAVVSPSVKGTDVAEGSPTGNVGENFTPVSASVKYQVNEKLALALGYDQPFGIDVKYNPTPYTMSPTSDMQAHAKVHALTALAAYKPAQNIWVYGGPAYYSVKGSVALPSVSTGNSRSLRDREWGAS